MLYRLKTDDSLRKQYQYAGKFKGGAFPTQAIGALFNLKFGLEDISAIIQLFWWLLANIRLSHWFSMILRVFLRKEIGMRLIRIDEQFFSILLLAGLNYIIWWQTTKWDYWLISFGILYLLFMLADFAVSQKSSTEIHTSYPGTSLIYESLLSKIVGRSTTIHLWSWIIIEPVLSMILAIVVFFYLDAFFGVVLGVGALGLFFKELQTWIYNLRSFTNIDESDKDKQILQAYYSNQFKPEERRDSGNQKDEEESSNEARIL